MALRALTSAALLHAAAGVGGVRTGTARDATGAAPPFVGAYVLIDAATGPAKLAALAANAATLPINRLFISFFRPSLVYVPGSNTLANTGLGLATTGDYGFAILKQAITTLQAGGVQVMLSIGGWDDNCWPYMYARYSVGGYGTNTPNWWEIEQYGGGDVNNCVESNQWCYVCEPTSDNATVADFGMFPEPFVTGASGTWAQAVAYVTSNGGGGNTPQWDPTIIPNRTWTDPLTGIALTVPGTDLWYRLQRDPYADLVYLAKDLGAAGIDVDYEEVWHADYFKIGPAGGPWSLPQTVFKYAAVLQDIILNIQASAPSLLLSTPAGAAGAWSGNWWGGNLKGVWYFVQQWYPSVISFMAAGPNAGGVNVMTYDLSDNEDHYECPTPALCPLDQQVNFYMGTYAAAGIPAAVGYETGTPAYPSPVHDPTHQLPLTAAELALILANTQPAYTGGFLWEAFKPISVPGEQTATQVAQGVCGVVMPGSPRCNGTFPAVPPPPTPAKQA